LITNRAPLREIQNYTNGRKPQENIPFEIKKIIDSREWIPKEWRETPGKYSVIKCKSKSFKSKGSNLYVPNTLQPKIFGSNSKVLISKVSIPNG
jgi:hypothetical protein